MKEKFDTVGDSDVMATLRTVRVKLETAMKEILDDMEALNRKTPEITASGFEGFGGFAAVVLAGLGGGCSSIASWDPGSTVVTAEEGKFSRGRRFENSRASTAASSFL